MNEEIIKEEFRKLTGFLDANVVSYKNVAIPLVKICIDRVRQEIINIIDNEIFEEGLAEFTSANRGWSIVQELEYLRRLIKLHSKFEEVE
jgi:hypothetical protein